MKYHATRTRPNGTSYTIPCDNIREAGKAIYFWLTDNGYEDRPQARKTAYQAEQDGGYTGYGSTWTITPDRKKPQPKEEEPPALKIQVTKDGPAYLLPGVDPAPRKRGDADQLTMF